MKWMPWDPLNDEEPGDERPAIQAGSPREAALAFAVEQCRFGHDDGVYATAGGQPVAVRLPPERGGHAVVYLVGYESRARVPDWPGEAVDECDLVVLSQASAKDAAVYLRGRVPKGNG